MSQRSFAGAFVVLAVCASCTKPAPTSDRASEASVEAKPSCADLIQARSGVVLGNAHVRLSGDRDLDELDAPALCTTSDAQHWLVPKGGVVFAACTREGLITLTMTDRALGHVDFAKGEWQGSNIAYDPKDGRSDRPRGQRVFSFIADPTKSVDIGAEHTKVRATFDGAKPLRVEADFACRF